MKELIYSTEKISDHIYRISEIGRNNCFLITGSEKAMLVDCGVGLANIKEEIKKITSLPVFLVATHAHADHIGGAREFGRLYVHRFDLPITRYSNSFYQRSLFLKKHDLSEKRLPAYKPYLFIKTFDDGEIFDLGGLEVEAINTPGHSKGSCIFRIEKDNIILLGDNFIPMLFLHYGFAASLSDWMNSCERLFEVSKGYFLYGGHGRSTVSREGLQWQYNKASEIVSETKSNDKRTKKRIVVVNNPEHKHLLIKYRTDNIL